jgi:hypothetical protein
MDIFTVFTVSLNVVAEWLTFVLRIREVSDSNAGLETSNPD